MMSTDIQNQFIFCVITGIQNTLVVWRLKGRSFCHRKAHRIDGEKCKADFATGSGET